MRRMPEEGAQATERENYSLSRVRCDEGKGQLNGID
jgi:hypothetical protein